MLKSLTRFYQKLIYYAGFLKSPILLLCRLFWGWAFLYAGYAKLSDISHIAETFANLHFPFPHFFGYIVGLTELIGGICLLIGFASRLAAIPLIITMVGAYLTVHSESVSQFFHNPELFVKEAPFNFLLTSVLVLAFGPGRFSVDYFLEKWLFARAEGIPKHQHYE